MKSVRARSAKLVEPRKIVVVEGEETPEAGRGEALIRVKAVGICGTDVHVWNGERPDVVLPRIMGHEFSGIVEKDSSRFRKGDRVVVDPVVSCGSCVSCRRGYPNLCAVVRCLGVQVEGAFRDLVSIPEDRIYRISESLTYVQAAMVEPYSIASEVLFRGAPAPGEKALVFGAGTIGLCVLEGLRLSGLSVMVVDFVESRLERARELGADRIVNGKKENLSEAVKTFTEDFGIDFTVDAVGNPEVMKNAIETAAPGGRIVVLGFNPDPAPVAELSLVRRELKIIGTRMNCNRFPEVIGWFEEGKVHPDILLSGIYPLEDIQEAFEHIVAEPEATLKVVITL